jgi:arylsulfatase A-like enzyme
MDRREFLASGAAGLAGGAAQSPIPARPNIVLILADDLGWSDVGYHGSEIQTPNIDGLAAKGVRFTNLYAYPLCTPTRAGLMTGRSPARYGLIYSVVRPWSPYGLPLDEHAMPETFRALGYQTAMVGKWHLGHAHRLMLPNARGFDHFYGFVNADIDYYRHTHMGGLDWQRNGTGVREEGYSTDLLATEAERIIAGRDRTRPLFLYVAFNAIHSPLQAPEHLYAKYGHIRHENRRLVAAMADAMDQAVGRVLAALDGAGMSGNTLVMFLSDNGGVPYGGVSNRPLRGGKMTTFEGGIRVPAAMRWPGALPAGGEVRQVMTVLDLLPTLASAAGGKPAARKDLDGKDMWPRITGAPLASRESLYFASKRNETAEYNFALRRGEWKLVREVTLAGVSEYLFAIEQDPEEKNNLAAQHPEIVKSLGAEIDAWRALHPRCEVQSSMTPHPGWIPPRDYAQAAGYEL